jgi:hypothetical protein
MNKIKDVLIVYNVSLFFKETMKEQIELSLDLIQEILGYITSIDFLVGLYTAK